MREAESAWQAHVDGDYTRAYTLAQSLPRAASLSVLSVRAGLLSRHGEGHEALPAIGQYGAAAAREGELLHMARAELLASYRVREQELAAHIVRVRLLLPRLAASDLEALRTEFHILFGGVEAATGRLETIDACLSSGGAAP